MLQLGECLGRFLYEVRDIPASEFDYWIAYFNIKERKQEVENLKNKSDNRDKKKDQTFG